MIDVQTRNQTAWSRPTDTVLPWISSGIDDAMTASASTVTILVPKLTMHRKPGSREKSRTSSLDSFHVIVPAPNAGLTWRSTSRVR